MNTPEQDMQDRAMSYSLEDDEEQAMIDALGHDALQNVLADAKRRELRSEIADFDRYRRQCEEQMWDALRSIRLWREKQTEAEAELAKLVQP